MKTVVGYCIFCRKRKLIKVEKEPDPPVETVKRYICSTCAKKRLNEERKLNIWI